MILNLHGFLSSGSNRKKEMLIELFPDEKIVSPDLPLAPKEAINLCSKILSHAENEGDQFIVGSSLGGFYTYCLAARHQVPCLLINPSMIPFFSLVKSIGEVTYFKRDLKENWTIAHIKELRDLFGEAFLEVPNALVNVIVALDDESINHRETTSVLRDFSQHYIEMGRGGHRFEDLEMITDSVLDIRNAYLSTNFTG
jgi:uncharacterized protein